MRVVEMTKIVAPGGKHIILELDNCDAEWLRNVDSIQKTLEQAAQKSDATILHTYMHHFGGEYGVTGLVALAESHISIHTWPESNYCAIDIFMCGQCDPMIAADHIVQSLQCISNITIIARKSQNSA
mgnify:CR=1 FL=1|jgi:S-adenosylmethionine decarboxylase